MPAECDCLFKDFEPLRKPYSVSIRNFEAPIDESIEKFDL